MTNEKRAHDLTMLYLQEQMKQEQIAVRVDDNYIDCTLCYTDTYTAILGRLNQEDI